MMPPRKNSRYTFSRGYENDNGDFILTDPSPYRYRPFSDNSFHTVESGDNLFNIAAKYFKGFNRPSGLYWIIADFQPDPVHDPTLKISEGTQLIIPSMRTVIEYIFSSKRYEE
jgi:hypothetical protein